MSRRRKIKAEEQIVILQKYVADKISRAEASRQCGVKERTIARWRVRYETEGVAGFLSQKNKSYSPELKRSAVSAYLSGQGSVLEICRVYKIRDEKQLRDWIKVYNGHKDFKRQTGGTRMTKGRETSQDERIAIAKACVANGKDYGEIALEYNVSYQQARNWTLKYIEGGEAALEDRRGRRKKDQQPRTELEQAKIEIEQLKHKMKILETENRLLKKLGEIERRRG